MLSTLIKYWAPSNKNFWKSLIALGCSFFQTTNHDSYLLPIKLIKRFKHFSVSVALTFVQTHKSIWQNEPWRAYLVSYLQQQTCNAWKKYSYRQKVINLMRVKGWHGNAFFEIFSTVNSMWRGITNIGAGAELLGHKGHLGPSKFILFISASLWIKIEKSSIQAFLSINNCTLEKRTVVQHRRSNNQ